MEHSEALLSGSSPKIRKAANAIERKKISGYCSELSQALDSVIDNPKYWQTQIAIIKAMRHTNCADALPQLKRLIVKDFQAKVLYIDLAQAIAVLDGISAEKLDFFYESIETDNFQQICGVCRAILTEEIVPTTADIKKILSAVSNYSHLEGRGMTGPRSYIAAVSYLWPREETESFLKSCIESKSNLLVHIAKDSIEGRKTDKVIAA